MRCPVCQDSDSRVVDSRTVPDAIRRRRSCQACGHRFSTLERVEVRLPWVIKQDGRREPFSREKVSYGISLACRKRPIGAERIEEAVREVERRLVGLHTPEVASSQVGHVVMDVLREVDAVAYVRFASVYEAFESVQQFADAILPLRERP